MQILFKLRMVGNITFNGNEALTPGLLTNYLYLHQGIKQVNLLECRQFNMANVDTYYRRYAAYLMLGSAPMVF